MRELKTIEVDRWEPSEKKGMVKHVGMISPEEAFNVLEKHLKEVDMLPDEYFSPNIWDWKGVKELPDYAQASCNVNWGGSEGIYLDIVLLYRNEKQELCRFNFATGKTLGVSGDDFLRMSRIAAECSMMLNGRGEIVRFYEEEKLKSVKENMKPLDVVIQEAQDKQKSVLSEVAQYLNNVPEEKVSEFKNRHGLLPSEILANSALLARVAAEKQRLYVEYPNIFGEKNDPTETALHNVGLAVQEARHKEKYVELRKMKQASRSSVER